MSSDTSIEIIKLVSKAITLSIICFFLCWWITERKLTPDIMDECKDTCGNFSGYVEEVTMTTCECSTKRSKINETQWVLPKK